MHDEISEIEKKIEKCYSKNNNMDSDKSGKISDTHMILSYAIDFFSCVATGFIIGILLDKVMKTEYIFILAMFFLGVIAGIYNVLRKYKHF